MEIPAGYTDAIQKGGMGLIQTLWEYDGRTTVVCVDSYVQGVPKGWLFHACLGTLPFESLSELLIRMEFLLEENGFPQSYTAPRSFGEICREMWPGEISSRMRRGNMATFSLQICYRRNASWQGRLLWKERGEEQSFRSVLELVLLLDSALRSTQRSDAV